MVNIDKLLGKIKECKMTQEEFCIKLSIAPSTFYRKIKSFGESFTVREIYSIAKILSLTYSEIIEIFLPKNSQKCDLSQKGAEQSGTH